MTSDRVAAAPAPDPFAEIRARPTGVRIGGRRFELAPHHCFACGELNEHGMRLVLHADEAGCWTELTLGPRFEGWDGVAHGGILCTVLDEVQAWAVIAHGGWGVTARMTVDFRRPVSIAGRIRAEGRVTEARRRLYRTIGRIVDTETGDVLVTAESTFVAATEERRAELSARYGISTSPQPRDIPDTVA